MAEEQRKHPRLHCAGDAELHLLTELAPRPAKVQDLSIQGCLLLADRPVALEPGTLLEISFVVNRLPFRVKAQLRVARSATMFGFQFFQVSARTTRQLEDLIVELQEDNFKLAKAPKTMRADK